MATLFAFLSVSLDGRTADADGGLSWQCVDAEFDAFARAQLSEAGGLLLGRRTYETMAAFWPTPAGETHDPGTAAVMNALPKTVASRTVDDLPWGPATVVRGDLPAAVRRAKEAAAVGAPEGSGPAGAPSAVAVLGSSTLTAALAHEGLLDELRVMVNPVVLGAGPVLLDTLPRRLALEPCRTRVFRSGAVLLTYRPAACVGPPG